MAKRIEQKALDKIIKITENSKGEKEFIMHDKMVRSSIMSIVRDDNTRKLFTYLAKNNYFDEKLVREKLPVPTISKTKIFNKISKIVNSGWLDIKGVRYDSVISEIVINDPHGAVRVKIKEDKIKNISKILSFLQ